MHLNSGEFSYIRDYTPTVSASAPAKTAVRISAGSLKAPRSPSAAWPGTGETPASPFPLAPPRSHPARLKFPTIGRFRSACSINSRIRSFRLISPMSIARSPNRTLGLSRCARSTSKISRGEMIPSSSASCPMGVSLSSCTSSAATKLLRGDDSLLLQIESEVHGNPQNAVRDQRSQAVQFKRFVQSRSPPLKKRRSTPRHRNDDTDVEYSTCNDCAAAAHCHAERSEASRATH